MNIFASPSRAPGQAGQTYNENWSETTMNHDAFDAHEAPRPWVNTFSWPANAMASGS